MQLKTNWDPPKPRTDLPPPKWAEREPDEWIDYLDRLGEVQVDLWRDKDGVLHLRRLPSWMFPSNVAVDTPGEIKPGEPGYEEFASSLNPHFDFYEETP